MGLEVAMELEIRSSAVTNIYEGVEQTDAAGIQTSKTEDVYQTLYYPSRHVNTHKEPGEFFILFLIHVLYKYDGQRQIVLQMGRFVSNKLGFNQTNPSGVKCFVTLLFLYISYYVQ